MAYLSLFFDDSGQNIANIILQESKDKIYSNYKNKFHANMSTQQDFQNIINNTLLGKVSEILSVENNLGMPAYWDVNMGMAHAAINKVSTEAEKVSQALKYISSVQQELSSAIEMGKGIIPRDLNGTLEKAIAALERVAASFNNKVANKGFDAAFYGAYQGAIRYAQGAIHEAAAIIGAAISQDYVNEELHKTNSQLSVSVIASGGTFIESGELTTAANKSGLKLGMPSGNKNDLTIIISDKGSGEIIWTDGVSLKSTTAANPNLVHIVSTNMQTILNKVYDQQTYLNFAAALGQGDWAGTYKGIGGIAKNKGISTTGAELNENWKNIVYDAIYSQIINFFGGFANGGILNNAQYLIINRQVVPMYSLFAKLEAYKNIKAQTDTAISGIKIEGAKNAINRMLYVQKNIDAFKQGKTREASEEVSIERSGEAWKMVSQQLANAKISISLKWAELGLGMTK